MEFCGLVISSRWSALTTDYYANSGFPDLTITNDHGHEVLGLAFLRQYHPTLFPHLPAEGHFNQRRTLVGPNRFGTNPELAFL